MERLAEVPRLSPRVLLRGLPGRIAVREEIPVFAAAAVAGGPEIIGAEEEEEGGWEDEEAIEDHEYMDVKDIYLRKKFHESWLWMDVNLPSAADKDG